MVDLQTAVSTLMEFALNDGDSAMKDLLKGVAVNSATGLVKVWQDIFAKDDNSKDLIIKLQDEDNPALRTDVEAIISKVLEDNPHILKQMTLNQQNIDIKEVKAKKGGIAIGGMNDSKLKVINK